MKVFSQSYASDLAVPGGHLQRFVPRKGAIEHKEQIELDKVCLAGRVRWVMSRQVPIKEGSER